MKTHIPTKLRKALIAALFAVSAVAYNAQAAPVDIVNSSEGYAYLWPSGDVVSSTGYADLTFNGTHSTLGTVDHWSHDGDAIDADHYQGDNTYIELAPEASGKYVAHSIVANRGKDDNSTIVYPYHDCSDWDAEFGYSSSWSNGNINVKNGAIVEVTSHITANGTLDIKGSSRVTSEGSVTAGAINVTSSQLTAQTITVTDSNTLWVVEEGVRKDDIKTSGALTVQDATVNATNIKVADAVYGSNGIIKGLPDSDLTVSGKILTENAKYVASSGYAVKVETIGDIHNAGTVAEPDWTVRGNNNRFGYKEDGTSVLAAIVEVNGDVVSNGNKIAATGSNLVAGTPTISITGTVGRTDEPTGPADGNELYAMKGDITVGALADNTHLKILAEDGGVEIKNASAATIEDSSITATDDVVIAAAETDSKKQLKLINTDVTSEDGDITAKQVLVMEKGTLSAENGDVTAVGLNGKAASVHAINLEAGNINLDADTSSTADVVLTGDMTSTKGTIIISNYNGADPRVTVDGTQQAQSILDISNSNMAVGEDQKTVKGDMSVAGSTLTVGGNQDSARKLDISSSTVDIAGDEKAGTRLGVHGSTLTVGADQTAGTSMAIDSGSKVTVGHVDEETGELVGGNQKAKMNINIEDSDVTVLADQTSTDGSIIIRDLDSTKNPTKVAVNGNQKAKTDITASGAELTVGTIEEVVDEETGEITYELHGGNQTAETGDIRIDGSIADILGHQEAEAGSIYVTGGSELTVGAIADDGTIVQESNQTALKDIKIVDSQVHVMGNETATEGSIVITVGEDGLAPVVTIDGDQEAGDSILTFGAGLTVGYIEEIVDETTGETTYKLHGGNQTADNGNIGIVATEATVYGNVTALGDGAGLVAVFDSIYNVGTSLTANELVVNTVFDTNASVVTINLNSATVEGEPLETVLDVDTLKVSKGSTLHTGNVKMDETDVTIKGAVEVGVKDEDPEKAIAANWDTEGSHLITGEDASLKANGNIRIAAVQDGDTIVVNDGARVAATGDVTIEGLADALAQVDNAHVVAKGDVTFSNAVLSNNAKPQIRSTEGDIVLKDRVEISDTQLNIQAPEGTQPGSIVVEKGADVQLYQGTVDVFNGALAGTGTVTANDENLVISYDSPDFNGTINMVRDNEQTLYIASKGVGDKAILSMQKGSSLGTIVGGQDANLGNVVTTDGSHIQMNAVDKGNRTTATSLNLTAGTTYELFASTDDTTGALLADTITVSNGINANGARVRVHSDTPLESLADGSRFTIAGGTVVSGFNEDVLYDMVKPEPTAKRTARALQTRNMHVEHTAHGVDLVVSENYKGIDDRNTNAVAVRDVILPLDVAADHRPGKLAGSASQLDHVLDALDYTRSGADAREGLLSLSGAANLIVPNMMMDASRHHLSDLRDHMKAPVCTDTRKTKGNVWAAYIGGYDHIGGDDNMHAYSHSYQGALVGGDYALNCNWALGLSVGYQKSIARTEGTRADADAISGDLYAVGRTGKYTHRFSMGLTSYSTDVKRGTRIAAAGHTYYGQSTGSADGMSWNFGYQLSRDFAINESSSITPYLAVDVAMQRIDTLNEKGQGDTSVVTDYEDFVQTDAALGVAYSHTFTSFNRQTGVFSLNLAAHGEFSEHRATAKNHFVGSADTWKTRSMKRAPFYGEVGADVIVPFGQHISGTAGVNFEFSADRTFVGGHAGVNYRF